ncbi:MAG: hypothetical protein ABI347_04605 [Nitrososphaera sp.]|jgi:hypothetical protein
MVIDYQFLELICQKVLDAGSSIRWVGIMNDNGVIISSKQRKHLEPILTHQDNEEYALTAITRYKTRTKFEAKTGRLRYAFARYEGLSRATIPMTKNFYLLITLDKEENDFDAMITNRIFPLIQNYAARLLEFSIERHSSAEYESGTFRCASCAQEFITKKDADEHYAQHKEESVHAGE